MITSAINPAALLTANKVPYAAGAGRLSDSGITFDPAVNGNITVAPNGSGKVLIGGSQTLDAAGVLTLTSGSSITLSPTGAVVLNGPSLFGKTTSSANGRIQIVSHSAMTGGVSFGTLADGTETLWRESAGKLKTSGTIHAANFEIDSNFLIAGVTRINTTQPAWTCAGINVRTFDYNTADLTVTKQAFATLVSDLRAIGILA